MNKSISLVVVLAAMFAVGCGDKGGGADSASASGSAKGGDSKAAGGKLDDYIKAACDAKDAKALSDVQVKFKDTIASEMAKITPEQGKKLADCTTAAASKM